MHRRSFFLASALPALLPAQQPPPAYRRDPNYDEAKVGSYELPDPLTDKAGVKLKDPSAWPARRAEIQELFESEVYGRTPEIDLRLETETIVDWRSVVSSKGQFRQARLFFRGAGGPHLDILTVLPKNAKGPVPVFAGLNYQGNHAILADTAIPLSTTWKRATAKGVVNHRSTEASRGGESSRWPLEAILDGGFGVATAHYGDLFPDRADGLAESIIPKLVPDATRSKDSWNAISAWAWGISRILDHVVTIPAANAKRVIAIGHSRLGKTALWAAAQDERFWGVVSNDSGEGGAALSRRNYGEKIIDLNHNFPYWFSANYAKYSGRANDLPVDQHMLLALIAPRLLYVASAEEDRWADPEGERLAAEEAKRVYKFLGAPADSVGYHRRPGGHDITAEDWGHFLRFFRKHV